MGGFVGGGVGVGVGEGVGGVRVWVWVGLWLGCGWKRVIWRKDVSGREDGGLQCGWGRFGDG